MEEGAGRVIFLQDMKTLTCGRKSGGRKGGENGVPEGRDEKRKRGLIGGVMTSSHK